MNCVFPSVFMVDFWENGELKSFFFFLNKEVRNDKMSVEGEHFICEMMSNLCDCIWISAKK